MLSHGMGSSLGRKNDDDDVSFYLSGSMSNGQYTARLIADEGVDCEHDLVYMTKTVIANENQIIYIAEARGYLRIIVVHLDKRNNLPNAKNYQRIKHASIYAIPQQSKLTDEHQTSYEFRLSFSIAESILANTRSTVEKKLNDIARRIYYKYLKQDDNNSISSYFIKTCVLWICELYDLEHDYKYEQKEELETDLIQFSLLIYLFCHIAP
ncbi:unnamed protein product [Didymodactylos carnosus]|uniref:Uncharacterized protein n=1 Tax=Didymodactylos carnosus TaxID=1234261 RepID=A0A814X2C8_9BILA|nr:unnamed protein product [Didymodactylos carnosus]CAF3974034.1 unnamed protein product [Didymodactylos carnosus]